ncbi:MAG: 5-formyltetrahydrofolate cyclo-ligase [Nitrospirae bacterium]|nr:5-formyltetrahydrofolate cyclo-ligase [Nitrospirota bacterium]
MKRILRKKALQKRDSIPPAERKIKDELIKHNLFNLSEFKTAKRLLFYVSFRTEVSTPCMIEKSFQLGKRIIVPKVDKDMHHLRLYEIKDLNELTPGFMGIPEPSLPDNREREMKDVDLAIIPCIAFDYTCNRLGYGAGYYDVLLSSIKKKIPFVALAYEEQLIDSIPSEAHDVKVDIVVTDKRIIRFKINDS